MKPNILLRFFLSIFIVTIITNCSNSGNETKNEDRIETITIGKKDTFYNTIDLNNISNDIKYIKLETKNQNSLIGKVDKLTIYKDKIFILDKNITKSIYIFNMDGKLMNTINKIGKGPGEFLKPFDITIDTKNNMLLVYCQNQQKINYYNLEGDFLNEWKIGIFFWAFQYIYSDRLAVFTHKSYNYLEGYGDIPYNLLVFNTKNKKLIATEFKTNAEKGKSTPVYSNNNKYFSVFNNSVFLSWMFNDTIYLLDDNNTAKPKFVFKFQTHKINYDKYSEDSEIFRDIIEGNVWGVYSNVVMSNDFLLTKIAAGKFTDELSNVFYLLYDIKRKKSILFNKARSNTDSGVITFPEAVYKNYFVSVLYPEQLLNSEDNKNTPISLTGVANSIKEYDNPILMFTKFKYFNNE